MAIVEFASEEKFTKAIDIVDIGNTVIQAESEEIDYYYMLIKTTMGKTTILSFGPLMPDIPLLSNGFSVMCKKFDYKENKIVKEINTFLNDSRKKIINAQEILLDEVIFPDIIELFKSC